MHSCLLPADTGDACLQSSLRAGGVLLHGDAIRRGIVKRRLKGSRINLEEHLASLDIGAFNKPALLDDAAHLRTDFSNQIGGRPACQFGRDNQPLRFYGHDGDFRRGTLCVGTRFGLLFATPQNKQPCKNPHHGDSFNSVKNPHKTPHNERLFA